MLLAFALIINVNPTSAASINGTSSVDPSVSSDLSTNMANTKSVSAYSSKTSTNTNVKVLTAASSSLTKMTVSTTDNTRPKVTKADPVKNAVNVHTNKVIKISFSEAIKYGSKWITLKNSKGQIVAFTSTISGNSIYITPKNYLAKGTDYTLLFHTGSLTDNSGNSNILYKTKFTTVGTKKTVSAGLQKYLAPSAHAQSNNPIIKSLAASITAGTTSDFGKATKIFNWVRDHISYSFYYNTRYGALGTLKTRSANCADTAHLMVALERAAGLPARYQHGTCRFSSGTYGHVWAQVYVNGKWYYADGTSSRNSFGVIKNWRTSSFTLHGTYASLPF